MSTRNICIHEEIWNTLTNAFLSREPYHTIITMLIIDVAIQNAMVSEALEQEVSCGQLHVFPVDMLAVLSYTKDVTMPEKYKKKKKKKKKKMHQLIGDFLFYIPFNIIQVILRQWKGDKGMLSA